MDPSSVPDAASRTAEGFLIVTGSSAGGIDALMRFVSHLPDDIAAPVVVAQHLSPQHPSSLSKILAARTALPVRTIDEEISLEHGTLYVVPPGRDIEIVDSMAQPRLWLRDGPRPSIDRFFATAASAYGDRLIAIVLSGLGDDGSRGARAVKSAGGTVIIQDPRSAGFAMMPLSIPPTIVDMTALPEEMGKIVHGLVGSSTVPTNATDKKQLRTLLGQLRERSGIDFSQYKTPTIMRRLSRLMVSGGFTTLGEYTAFLQRNPDGYQRLVNSFLIKVTEFFRDTALYETLREQILPRLIAEARDGQRELRIWSAGTSTGEEAYSLAILCAEAMRDGKATINVRVFATDVDDQAIAFARRGIYHGDALHDVPKELIERYFTRTENRYEVSKRIRNMTVFGQHDLGQRAPFPRIDLVLCRNVLIYFTKELQTRALQLFAFALRDQGFLVLGKAESTTPLPQFFQLFNSLLKIYQRDGERVLLPPTRLADNGQFAPVPAFLGAAATQPLREFRNMQIPLEQPRTSSQDVIAALVAGSAVGAVVIDANYDIIAINSAARSMLQIHGVGVGSDLIHLVPFLGASLRALIDRVLSGEPSDPTVLQAKDPITGIDRWLQVHGVLQRPGAGSSAETAGLVIVDVTRYERRIQEDEAARSGLERSAHEHEQRALELSTRIRSMLASNQELTTVNAELRTYNEQLLINAEEAASAGEEIETLNEEMQATNEELETLNEELQATVEELNTTNDELEARSAELEQANVAKQEQVDLGGHLSDALSVALDGFAPPYAIVADGSATFVSPAFRELVGDAEDGSWLNATSITTPKGERYEIRTRHLDGSSLKLVTLAQ